VNSCLE